MNDRPLGASAIAAADSPGASPAFATPVRVFRRPEDYAMLEPTQTEELICLVSAMDRDVLIDRLTDFRGRFPVDFTREFLNTLPVDRLRHIFLALCLQTHHVPEMAATA